MAKTQETLRLEKALWTNTRKTGLFACFEVTIGINGHERVDYLTWDTKGIWRAYEIKVSKSDFRSRAAKSFVGHYNYYVMPLELYNQVRDMIPDGIGVHDGSGVIVPARRREPTVSQDVLMTSLMRSMYRDSEQYVSAGMHKTPVAEWKEQKQRESASVKMHRLRDEVKTLRMFRDTTRAARFYDFERRYDMMTYWRERAKAAESKLKVQ